MSLRFRSHLRQLRGPGRDLTGGKTGLCQAKWKSVTKITAKICKLHDNTIKTGEVQKQIDYIYKNVFVKKSTCS